MIKMSMVLWDSGLDQVYIIKNSKGSFVNLLHNKSIIPQNLFSLCFAPNGGYFSIGGINNTLHSGQVRYIPFYDASFYRVKLKDVIVNSKDFHLNYNEYYTIVDSGTTISYFPKTLYTEVEKQINIFCSQVHKCLGDSYPTDNGLCFKIKENVSLENFLLSMPDIHFTFEKNVKYTWKPQSYLYNSTDSNINDLPTFCIGLTGWASNEILLGSTWMHNHDIIFDLENRKIGFVESNCSGEESFYLNYNKFRNVKVISSNRNCEVTVNMYFNIILTVTIISIFIISLISLAVYRLNQGNNFLWTKLSTDESGII